jgi:cytochrome c oxidase subunit IV
MSDQVIEHGHGHDGHEHVEHAPHESDHPGWQVYTLVAVVLIVLTAMEIGVFYAPSLQAWLVPMLIILAVLKFILVAGFYMHLKYDSPVFTTLFAFPLLLAMMICGSLMLLFLYLGRHSAGGLY